MRLTAIVLAAGSSSRLGEPKQLVVFEGETLVRRAVRIAIEAGCGEVIAVLPPGEFAEELAGLDVRIVENHERDEGIASSVRAGVAAAGEGRLLITLCDQPFVIAGHLRNLIATEGLIVATAYGGSGGVPAVFAPELRDELMALQGDRGARGVIEAHRHECVMVPFEAAAADVDTPDDLTSILDR